MERPQGTRGQGDKGTRGQGDKGTRGQGDKGTRRQGDRAMLVFQRLLVPVSTCPIVLLSFYPITITDTLRSRDSSSSIRKILCQRPNWSRLSATLTQTDIGRKRA